ncbi:sugar transferase [Hungatella hathewayi]|uniref:sugar transferase n=1 Tax=Hungatella hathewayi TaxID=154046 RepID=UPI0035658D19
MYRFSLVLKRGFDIISSLTAIVLLIPLWIGVSLAIKQDSKGPVFFKQERRTKDGRVFQMLKFRSMIVNAENMGTGLFNYENDPRVTKVGRRLRNSSVDELPQLFNILSGTMSVVGPRPCVKYELGDFDTLNRKYKKRFEVKAGLTGLAQIKGRNEISWDEKVNYDNQYVDQFKKYGVITDIRILMESVVKVLRKEDICENKADESLEDVEAARLVEKEIIRIAHIQEEEMKGQI